MRRLIAPGIVVAMVSLVAPIRAAEPARIVEQSEARAVIVVPAECDEQTKAAAAMLADYVRQSTGARLPVVDEHAEEASGAATAIHVGRDEYVKERLSPQLEKLDEDGFVIRCEGAKNVAIAGPTPWGTEFGVCEFLERYVGVRWLMPGPDGTDVPRHATIEIPVGEVLQEPAFFSRAFSGLSGDQATWARRNRLHARVSFHHNLQRLFAPEKFAKTHPEFYPIRKGERYIPPDSNTHGWQPCFSAPGSVQAAIEEICRYFDEHPEEPSYSLGVVDSSGHCECDACQAQDPEEKNFLGRRNCSDRYYGWCNRVVEGVLRKHPDKWFGCLAYSEVAQAPDRVKVHPRIIPFMTYDRMKWIDPELRAAGERSTEAWHAASPVLGWYDYIYGSAYCLPRVWFHAMGDYYRWGHAHGVRAMYAEAYPNWGEGPKLYVSLKLQWDPSRDVDTLLREWYARAVGEAAADDLAAYYARWEDFWTRRIRQSKWFTPQGQYLAFYSPAYLADVTEEDIRTSRRLLECVLAKAATDAQRARARLLMLAFEYYEASAVAYGPAEQDAATEPIDEGGALALLDRAERRLQMARKRRRLAEEEFPKHPELACPIRFDRYEKLRGDDWGTDSIWAALDWAGKSPKVHDRLRALADPAKTTSLAARTMLALLDSQQQAISKDPSFESAGGKWPTAWSRWIKWGTGSMDVRREAARSGEFGVLCRGLKRGGPLQSISVAPGTYGAVAAVRLPKAVRGNVTAALSITPQDDKGAYLPGYSTKRSLTPGNWTRIATAGEIPAAVDGKPVKSVRLLLVVDGLEADEELYFDDLEMFSLDDVSSSAGRK